MLTPYKLANLYQNAHNTMRNIDGLQPQEAFDELLKFLFFKQVNEEQGPQIKMSFGPLFDGLQDSDDIPNQIRKLFREYLGVANSWSQSLWRDAEFQLDNITLLELHNQFGNIKFGSLDVDMRSAALRTFLTPEIRRGLGIFLTPDNVVQMMVEVVDPKLEHRVFDPACGSGTFLIETIKYWQQKSKAEKFEVWGCDKNPRMLLLSELNLGHFPKVTFHRKLFDSLTTDESAEWPKLKYFDTILTNPPFGVVLQHKAIDLSSFNSCRLKNGKIRDSQYSEIVFIEQSLRLLKPGGKLGIVLPRSIVTNSTFSEARQAIEKLGYIYAVVNLPPETFYATGTQSTTVVLFFKKFTEDEQKDEPIQIALAEVTNVGFDSTGRNKEGDQLCKVASAIQALLKGQRPNVPYCHLLDAVPKNCTLSSLHELLFRPRFQETPMLTLEDVIDYVGTGKTPARSNYTSKGLFLLKVGNLSGNGINWIPRDRNFAGQTEAIKRRLNSRLMLQPNDIVLTSSAHSRKYIAGKVDIITSIPANFNEEASYVGELMLLRPNPRKIDPFILLAYLRSAKARGEIQQMIRGQTAHLYPNDIVKLALPIELLSPNEELEQLAALLRIESQTATEMSKIGIDQNQLLAKLF